MEATVAGDADHEARAEAEGIEAAVWVSFGRLGYVGAVSPAQQPDSAPVLVPGDEGRGNPPLPDLSYTTAAAAAPLIPLIEQWQDWSVIIMLRIGKCESGLDVNAVSEPNSDGLRDYGYLQNHGSPVSLDPVIGTAISHEKYVAAGGYSPWASSQRCWG